MTTEENIAVVSRIWNEIWNRGKLNVSYEVFAPNYLGIIPAQPEPVRGPEAFNALVAAYRQAFPDVHVTVEDVFAAGDRVAVRWVSRGTHLGPMMGLTPTGRCMEVMGISIFQMVDGQVAVEWEGFDTMGMMRQIT